MVCALSAALIAYCHLKIHQLESLDAETAASSGSYVDVLGLKIHYEAYGSGIPVVFIHGFGGSTYSWRMNLQFLGTGFRAYALDLPGFGYSQRTSTPLYNRSAQARVVRTFLHNLGENQRAVIVGSSLGAGVALRYAIDFPEQTRGLILVAPALRSVSTRPGLLKLFSIPLLGRELAAVIYYLALANPHALSRFLASAYGAKASQITEEMRESMLRPVRVKGSAQSALGLARSREPSNLWDAIPTIRVPILIIAGRLDRAVPLQAVERLHEWAGQSKLEVICDAGHLVQEEVPQRFNRLVTDFLRSLEG